MPQAGQAQGLKVGLLPVMAPRIDLERQQRILGYLNLEEKLQSLGVEVVWPGRVVWSRRCAESSDNVRLNALHGMPVVTFVSSFDRILSAP